MYCSCIVMSDLLKNWQELHALILSSGLSVPSFPEMNIFVLKRSCEYGILSTFKSNECL